MEQSIQKIKEIFQAADMDKLPELLLEYESDSRAGVQNVLKSARKRIEAFEKEIARTESLKEFERKYEALGYVCGIDEVGRGQLSADAEVG